MPPRTRKAAAAAAAAEPAPAPAGFASLPDAVVQHIFELVGGAKQRHRLLPTVCRRWNQLCCSMLRELTLHVGGNLLEDGPTVGERLQTLFRGLLRSGAARHVQRLELHMLESSYAVNHLDDMFLAEAPAEEFWIALNTGVMCVGEDWASQSELPRELLLYSDVLSFHLPEESSAPLAQSGLRRLHACLLAEDDWFETVMRVGARLQAFTALQDLRITSYHLLFEPGVRLPPSLTSLELGREVVSDRDLGAPLPQLLAPLMRLQRLGLRGTSLAGVDLGALSGSLTHLALRDCGALPASTSRLTALESLAWENSHQMQRRAEAGSLAAAAADAALSCLTRLTFLSLMTLQTEDAGAPQLPPSLSGLGRLHTASLLVACAQALPLPANGPYLTSLRRLLLSGTVAAASPPALSAMPDLEVLSLLPLSKAMDLEGYQTYPEATRRREREAMRQAAEALQPLRAARPRLRFEAGHRAVQEGSLYWRVAQQTMARRLEDRD